MQYQRLVGNGLRVYLAGVVAGYAVMAFEVKILGAESGGSYMQTFLMVYGVPLIVGLLAIMVSPVVRPWLLAAGALPVFFLHVALLVNIAMNPMHLMVSALLSFGILKSFHARSSQAALNEDPNSVEFKLDAGPIMRAWLKTLLALVLIGESILIALYLIGNINGEDTLFLPGFLVAMSAAFAVSMWRMHSGVVLLKANELEVRTRDGRQLYWWDDIAEIRALQYRDLGFLERLPGYNPDLWLVRVALRRWHRFGFLQRPVYIYVSDPAAFVQAANAFLVTR